MVVTIAGCSSKRKLVDFAPFTSFVASTEGSRFTWQDPDRWELKVLEDGIERAHWIGIGEKLYVRDYSDSAYWETKNPGIDLASVMDARKLKGKEWQMEGDHYLILNKNYQSGREKIQHLVWVDFKTGWPLRQQLIGDTGTSIATYSGINTIAVNIPTKTKPAEENAEIWLLPNSLTATYSAEMKLRGLPMVWPFTATDL